MKKREPIDNTKPRDWYEEADVLIKGKTERRPVPWNIVRTEPMRETTLQTHLIARGIPVYNPQVKKQEPNRGRQTRTVWRALFPGYVFVLLGNHDTRYLTTRKLPGFLDFLHTGDRQSPFACIDGQAIAALGEQEFKLSTRHRCGWTQFSVGQPVRFSIGPFEGLLARITAIEPNKRISVLRDLFGRETIVKVHADEIEAA